MAKVFEVGKYYGAWDTATPPVKVIKRTAKTVTVQNEWDTWMMRIKVDWKGHEYVTDSKVPAEWRECYTYDTRFEKTVAED